METQKKNYVLPIAMMFALFAMISFVTGLQNPMGIIVKNQFGASNFMSQLGNAANFIAYAFMGLPAGLMLQRIGYKKTALAAVAVGFIGVGISYLSGLMSSFSVYLIGAFVSGFSMCMLNTVVNPMLNTLGGGGNRGNQLVQFGGETGFVGEDFADRNESGHRLLGFVNRFGGGGEFVPDRRVRILDLFLQGLDDAGAVFGLQVDDLDLAADEEYGHLSVRPDRRFFECERSRGRGGDGAGAVQRGAEIGVAAF